jgi:hypothetical protein
MREKYHSVFVIFFQEIAMFSTPAIRNRMNYRFAVQYRASRTKTSNLRKFHLDKAPVSFQIYRSFRQGVAGGSKICITGR